MPFGGGGSVVPTSTKSSSGSSAMVFDLKEKKPFTLSNLGDIFKGIVDCICMIWQMTSS